jgi:hypothetical protein
MNSSCALPNAIARRAVEPRLTAPADDMLNLIVLSSVHRSGSTLLQRICNARKSTLIWGEHGGILRHFENICACAEHYSRAGSCERDEYFQRGEDPNVWIANMCPEIPYVQNAVVNSARTLLNTLYGQFRETHDIIGFKEAQYGAAELKLLRQCYPRAEILLLVRHPFHAWNSTNRSWYASLDLWADTWENHSKCFIQSAKSDNRCHLLRYESLIAQQPETMRILMEVAKVSRGQIADVLAHKIGSTLIGIKRREKKIIFKRCRETMEMLDYSW